MKTKNKAFTLAETLVVMGIIGVIAALTIPNLSQSTGNKEKITKVQKTYTQISEAIDRATAIYGPTTNWISSDATYDAQITRYGDRITEFMKLSKNCGTATDKGCKNAPNDTTSTYYKFQLADGTGVGMHLVSNSSTLINFDINVSGKVAKSDYGVNKFVFIKYGDGFFKPACRDYATSDYIDDIKPGGYRYCASTWILDYGNMDYLKMDSNWKCTTGSGKVLNITSNPPVTSCN